MARPPNHSDCVICLLAENEERAYRGLDQLYAGEDDRQQAWLSLKNRQQRDGCNGHRPAQSSTIIARKRKDRTRSEARRRNHEREHEARREASPSADPLVNLGEREEATLILEVAERATGRLAVTYSEKHLLDGMTYDEIAGAFETQARRVREMVNLVEDAVRIIAAAVREPIDAGELPDRLYPTPKRRIAAARAALTRAGAITDLDGVLALSTGASMKHERRDHPAASAGRTSTADLRCVPPRCPKCGVPSNSKVCPVRTAPCGLEGFFGTEKT